MKRHVLALIAALVVVDATGAYSQAPEPKIDIDFASFAYDGESTLLESYLAFAANSLVYKQDSTGLVSLLPVYLGLRHATITTLVDTPPPPVWSDSVAFRFSVPDTSYLKAGQHFIQNICAIVPAGDYQMMLTIPADTSFGRKRLVITRDIVVPQYSGGQAAKLSDIELAASIQPSQDRDSPFYRNGLDVRPNPNLLYGTGLTTLFYYVEAYNLDKVNLDSTYTVYTFISQTSVPQAVSGLEHRIKRAVRSPDVLVGSYDIGALASGSYLLNVVLLAPDNTAIVERSRKFFVFNPAVQAQKVAPAMDVGYEASIYEGMTEQEIDDQIQYAKVIATDTERGRMDRAKTLDEKKHVLQDFWQKRDPNPATPINEFRQEYFSRIQYARDRYSSSHAEGWQTDRGRTYLKYGMPAHINPHHYEQGTVPYEIWEYDNIPGEGKAMFVFADVGGFNEYELIHSDVPGEPKSLDWQAEVRKQR